MALNIFGDAPQSLTGLLGEQATEDLRKKAMTTGLINAAIGYIAQPKTMGYGSALPYIGRALMAGQQGAQGVYEGAITDWERQQKIEEFKRKQEQRKAFETATKNIFTTVPAQFETVTSPGGYAPQQTEVMPGQVSPNFGMTRLPDVSTQVQTAPARQEFDTQALMNLAIQYPELAAPVVTNVKNLNELAGKQEMLFDKPNVKDFTQDSIKKYLQTKNPADLQRVESADKGFGSGVEGAALNFLSQGSDNSPEAIALRSSPNYALAYRKVTEPKLVQTEKIDDYGNVRTVSQLIPAQPLPKNILPPIIEGQQTSNVSVQTGTRSPVSSQTVSDSNLSSDNIYNVPSGVKSSPYTPSQAEIKDYRGKKNQALRLIQTLDDLNDFVTKNPDTNLWGIGKTGAMLTNKYEKALTQLRLAAELGVLNKEDLPRLEGALPNPNNLTTWIKGGGTLDTVTGAIESEKQALKRDIDFYDTYLNPQAPKKESKTNSDNITPLPMNGNVINKLKLKNGVQYKFGVWNSKTQTFE
jgi:hypothetical protein